MTNPELEALAEEISQELFYLTPLTYPRMMEKLTTAYQLGRAQAPLTEAQRAAWERNRRRGGKPGRKDKQPRHRRTKAEMEAARQETQEK